MVKEKGQKKVYRYEGLLFKPIDFNLQERKKLREIFDDLDADGSGAIGVDELEEPFIALDLASNRDSINDLIKKVDEDGGGEIDFDEFLTIIRYTIT